MRISVMIVFVLVIATLTITSCRPTSLSSESVVEAAHQKTFKRETLEMTFAEMKKQPDWKLDGELLWGFFFTSPEKSPLVDASKVLEQKGYRVVSIYRDDEKRDW